MWRGLPWPSPPSGSADTKTLAIVCRSGVVDGSPTFQNSPRLATARVVGGVGDEKDSHLCLRLGAVQKKLRGRTTHGVSSSHRLKMIGLVGCLVEGLEQRAGMRSKSWSAAHKPPTAAVQTNTAGVSGGCRMRKAFITTPTPTKVGANVYWAQVGQGGSNL